MEDNLTYHWNTLNTLNQYSVDGNVSSSNSTILDLSFIKSNFKDQGLFFDEFKSLFGYFTIANNAKTQIDELLQQHYITSLNTEFYLISAIFQYYWITEVTDLSHITDKGWLKTLETAREQKEKFFDLLRLKVDKEHSGINSISFKTDKAQTINNFLIVDDILNALIGFYGLTSENFEVQKSNLSNYVTANFRKSDNRLKFNLMTGLNNFIASHNGTSIKSSDSIRFVGSFFLISQIPIKIKNSTIPIGALTSMLMQADDIKYLHTFLHRNDSF